MVTKRPQAPAVTAPPGAARLFWAAAAVLGAAIIAWFYAHPSHRSHSTHPAHTAPATDAGSTLDAGGTLDAAARQAIGNELRTVSGNRPVWITATDADPKATTRAEELAAIFTDAGWHVSELGHTAIRVRPGVFVFAADESPPGYVHTASHALELGGLAPTFAGGYREYYEQSMRERPGFQGFLLGPDQPYLVVVGRVE